MIVGLVIFLVILLFATVLMVNGLITIFRFGLPYVPSPRWAIESLIEKLHLEPRQAFVEIGCGDGRVLAEVARAFPESPCIGYELQWWPYLLARWRCRKQANVRIQKVNILHESLPTTAVVYGYFLSTMRPDLQDYLKRVAQTHHLVLLGFSLPGITPKQEITAPGGRVGTLRWYQPNA